jgi:hypothetical protein
MTKALRWLVVGVLLATQIQLTPQAQTTRQEQMNVGGQKDIHGCLTGAGYSWCTAKNKCIRPWQESCTTEGPLNSDVYPLYPGISWKIAGQATDTLPIAGVQKTLNGYRVTSESVKNITDIAAIAMPFEKYYANKLSQAAWSEDKQLAASGPGSDITVYTKGVNYIIVSYTSVFHTGGVDTPEECPCDLSLSIFSGAKSE